MLVTLYKLTTKINNRTINSRNQSIKLKIMKPLEHTQTKYIHRNNEFGVSMIEENNDHILETIILYYSYKSSLM